MYVCMYVSLYIYIYSPSTFVMVMMAVGMPFMEFLQNLRSIFSLHLYMCEW
jgi:hypothetical protein